MVSASGLKESKGSGWWQCTILTFCPKCHDKAMQYASLISSIPNKEGRGYGDHGKYDWQIIYFQFNPIFRLKGDNGGLTILSSCRECQRQSSMIMTWWRVRVVACSSWVLNLLQHLHLLHNSVWNFSSRKTLSAVPLLFKQTFSILLFIMVAWVNSTKCQAFWQPNRTLMVWEQVGESGLDKNIERIKNCEKYFPLNIRLLLKDINRMLLHFSRPLHC